MKRRLVISIEQTNDPQIIWQSGQIIDPTKIELYSVVNTVRFWP